MCVSSMREKRVKQKELVRKLPEAGFGFCDHVQIMKV